MWYIVMYWTYISTKIASRVKPKTIKFVFVASPLNRSKSKDWLARNKNNVSELSDMSIRGHVVSVS